MSNHIPHVQGAGLGLRRALMGPLAGQPAPQIGFMEVAPENWLGVGGRLGKQFRALTEHHPFICHGLSLSIGSPAPLDLDFINRLKPFFQTHGIHYYSEHLSYCSDSGHMYDLMPIPFTEEAVHYVAARIRQVQEILGQRIAMENISYYAPIAQELSESEFINAVLQEADCDLLLDVNNIFVNSINHGYDANAFLKSMPAERISYLHIAGHYDETDDLKIDTHGAAIIPSVWELLESTYAHFGVHPTLLERDFNIPPLPELLAEVDTILQLQYKWSHKDERSIAHG